jgi:hypothetical protein
VLTDRGIFVVTETHVGILLLLSESMEFVQIICLSPQELDSVIVLTTFRTLGPLCLVVKNPFSPT